MEFSEAVKLGAMIRPQGFGSCFVPVGDKLYSCAIGAAAEAIGVVALDPGVDLRAGRAGRTILAARARWPVLRQRSHGCPACVNSSRGGSDVCSLVAHLNDAHSWTRERIADYIAREYELPIPTTTTEQTASA